MPVLLLLAFVAGCTAGDPQADQGPSGSGSASSASPSEPSPSSPPSGPAKNPARTPACAEVRAGIDAFNAGDFDLTVEHFEKAVPLAQDQLDGSAAADDLLEAVTWYAQLPPDDYLDASTGSPDFARYKAITLGQCVSPGSDPGGQPSESSGTQI